MLIAVDLFSGAGGTTQGLRDAGYEVVAAVENDPTAAKTFVANHGYTDLLDRKIQHVQAPALARQLAAAGVHVDLLTACPPCQPFSTLGSGDADDPRNGLVSSVARFVTHLRPQSIMLENVPGLRRQPQFRRLLAELEKQYVVREYIVQAADFGIPQRRRRIIVLAVARRLDIALPRDLLDALPASFDRSPESAGEALMLVAGLTEQVDPLHRARKPQQKTIARIQAVAQGGGRRQLPKHLELNCHARLDSSSATSIYGRIDPAEPAPTMTTRCTTPSCGRFAHPTEDRGLTLREAAVLQTFPLSYEFHGNYGEVERQIGNAVPPRLTQALGLILAGVLTAGGEAESAASQAA
jgi:DNA (cytosine-5)-methyltransferase 1